MTKDELIYLVSDFSKHRNIFHSESDFQLEFGMYLIKNHFEVRLEKGFKQIGIYDKIELDIELNGCIAIELKYKTSYFKEEIGDESFELKQHGATNLGRFDAINDARRVKSLKDSNTTKIKKGFTIFLTNEVDYWSNNAERTMSKDFNLTEDRILKKGKILDWKSKSPNIKSVSKKRIPPFTPVNIDFNDVINWVEFSKIGNSKSGRFRFFVLDVNN
tara:strand:+ start:225 stop:875 length:651 start_codon:yes stop_codon:yes gene_type:complete